MYVRLFVLCLLIKFADCQIRTVGKGAYGAAVLYRKKDDDSLVILKEINMHELSYTERQLALNEVNSEAEVY